MADFCKQCSIDNFGEDTKDLAYERPRKLQPGEGWVELCEGCGPIIVDDDGVCIDPFCPTHGTEKRES